MPDSASTSCVASAKQDVALANHDPASASSATLREIPSSPDSTLTTAEVAAYLRVSPQTVCTWARHGARLPDGSRLKLPRCTPGRRGCFRWKDVLAFMDTVVAAHKSTSCVALAKQDPPSTSCVALAKQDAPSATLREAHHV